MKARAAGLLGLFALATLATPSLAFDGHRKGFMLGLGIGPGYTHLSTERSGTYEAYGDSGVVLVPFTPHVSDSRFTVATDLRLGFGLTDRLLVFYDSKASWSSSEDGLDIDGISSGALSYYLKDTHPSFYLTAGAGSVRVETFYWEGGVAQDGGWGLFGGGGYEMNQRSSLEGTITYGRLTTDAPSFKSTTDCVSIRVHLILQWY